MPKRVQDHLSALRVATLRLETFANHVPAMLGYWSRELRCEFANDAYLEWFGLSPHEAVGKRMVDLLGENLFKLNEPYARLALEGHAQRFEREIRKADGSMGYTDARYIPDADEQGNIRGFYVLVSDITELHNAYSRVRELAQRLESAREDERRSIAQTLHEGILQDLFATKFGLEQLRAQTTDRVGVTQAFTKLIEVTGKCITDTRQIANNLRPTVLTHMPTAVGIKEHARFFGELTKLIIRVNKIAPIPEMDEKLRLFLFRAAQEALTNVARHAKASTVEITLRAVERHVMLDIVDDGVGMPEGALTKQGSLGLLGLRERVQSLGGRLSVTNNISQSGTTVSVHVPLPNPVL